MEHTAVHGNDHADSHPDDLCVTQVPLFYGLGSDDLREVAAVARPTQLAQGEQVHMAGSQRAQLMVVHTGALKISRVDVNGREQILRVLEPGAFVGESAFVTGRSPGHIATALEPSSMCVFRHTDLNRLVHAHPSIGFRMLQGVSLRLEEIEGRLASLISGEVSSRLVNYLLSLPSHSTAGKLSVELPMAKKDIASLLDTTPESLSRQLRRLQESGLIAAGAGRQIWITDVDALMELSTQN